MRGSYLHLKISLAQSDKHLQQNQRWMFGKIGEKSLAKPEKNLCGKTRERSESLVLLFFSCLTISCDSKSLVLKFNALKFFSKVIAFTCFFLPTETYIFF